ncbi:hypothetical protein CROQUDRAFT_110955 [Cronartium quercuum f. sp. fusiforme G11]|uniref:Uncharacterized protein n=1 Tax=Cronartium quercuum f. sp. fusiforme G11 TaxID=708437 RepID=A0A9P6NAK9_9BASI|nr:hypothetical protein CROQUDRAFT_110955 [Cronartium quercuum f. sp. fusiforme G11]
MNTTGLTPHWRVEEITGWLERVIRWSLTGPILDRRKTRRSSSRFNGRVTDPKIRHRTVTWATALTCNHIGAVILLDQFGNVPPWCRSRGVFERETVSVGKGPRIKYFVTNLSIFDEKTFESTSLVAPPTFFNRVGSFARRSIKTERCYLTLPWAIASKENIRKVYITPKDGPIQIPRTQYSRQRPPSEDSKTLEDLMMALNIPGLGSKLAEWKFETVAL